MRGNLEETSIYLRSISDFEPEIAVVLGSGLDSIINKLDVKTTFSYDDVPHFYLSSVSGHKGNIVFAEVNGKKVILFQGRLHLYEGFSNDEVTFYVHLLNILGVKKLIITNAAGAINENYKTGDIMAVNDHINLTGVSPLINDIIEPEKRFVNMSHPYYIELFDKINLSAFPMQKGTLVQLLGPNYETNAEIKMLRTLGADAVTMSSVIEAIVAMYYNMDTICLSMITNESGDNKNISHKDVVMNAQKHKDTFLKLLIEILKVF
jgi:purine-nucleoside phosphorylase